MIDLAASYAPRAVEEEMLDFGFFQRPSSGAATLRVERPGTRMRATFSFPALQAAHAAAVLPRLKRARREGLRVEWPLLGIDQGDPGAPVIDGGGQAGITLRLRDVRAGHSVHSGFVLHIEETGSGARYWHEVQASATAGDDGKMVLAIEPPLRAPFGDGAKVELATPTFEGWMIENPARTLSLANLVQGTAITIEEAR